jgi:hypothetical protein
MKRRHSSPAATAVLASAIAAFGALIPAAAGAVDGVGAASVVSTSGLIATGGAFIPSNKGQGGD